MLSPTYPNDRDARQRPNERRRFEQSQQQRHRNRRLFRASRIANGYLVTLGDVEPIAVLNRQEVHAALDNFFDDLEADGSSGTGEANGIGEAGDG